MPGDHYHPYVAGPVPHDVFESQIAYDAQLAAGVLGPSEMSGRLYEAQQHGLNAMQLEAQRSAAEAMHVEEQNRRAQMAAAAPLDMTSADSREASWYQILREEMHLEDVNRHAEEARAKRAAADAATPSDEQVIASAERSGSTTFADLVAWDRHFEKMPETTSEGSVAALVKKYVSEHAPSGD